MIYDLTLLAGILSTTWETVSERLAGLTISCHTQRSTISKRILGKYGLNLPYVVVKGKKFYDFSLVAVDEDEKKVWHMVYGEIREIVAEFLIRTGPLPEDSGLVATFIGLIFFTACPLKLREALMKGAVAAPLRAARWVRVSTEEQSREGHAAGCKGK